MVARFLKRRLTLWSLTSGIPITQCDAENAERQVEVTAI
jgi:hypothetical protein